jgi:hypothetical protein
MALHPQVEAYLKQMEALALSPAWEIGVRRECGADMDAG